MTNATAIIIGAMILGVNIALACANIANAIRDHTAAVRTK